MALDEFVDILRRFREESGYEIEGVKSVKLGDGWEQIGPWPLDGRLQVVDKWRGFERFEGVMRILENGCSLWVMNYRGAIISPIFYSASGAKVVYGSVLKPALRGFPRERPFKRGSRFDFGCYSYFDECRGSFSDFSGVEGITFFGGRQRGMIYSGEYCGGFCCES